MSHVCFSHLRYQRLVALIASEGRSRKDAALSPSCPLLLFLSQSCPFLHNQPSSLCFDKFPHFIMHFSACSAYLSLHYTTVAVALLRFFRLYYGAQNKYSNRQKIYMTALTDVHICTYIPLNSFDTYCQLSPM